MPNGHDGLVNLFYPTIEFPPMMLNGPATPPPPPALYTCGRAPLIIFVHGDNTTFRSWVQLPASLARAGFLVAVPDAISNRATIIQTVIDFITATAPYRDYFDGTVGVAGHSLGGGAAFSFAIANQVGGFVGLAPHFDEAESSPPFRKLSSPTMIVWGAADNTYGPRWDISGPDVGMWEDIHVPKHLLTLPEAHHYDYVPADSPGVILGTEARGDCPSVPFVVADYVTAFFCRYFARPLGNSLGNSLRPAPLTSSPFNACFLDTLMPRANPPSAGNCRFLHHWEVGVETGDQEVDVVRPAVSLSYIPFGTKRTGAGVSVKMRATASGIDQPHFTWAPSWPGAVVTKLDARGETVSINFPHFTGDLKHAVLGPLSLTARATCGADATLYTGILPTYAAIGIAPPNNTPPLPTPLQP